MSGGGKRGNGKEGKGLQFTRQIPKFLQQYSQILQTDSNNYLGEQLGKDDFKEKDDEAPSIANEDDDNNVKNEDISGNDEQQEGEETDNPVVIRPFSYIHNSESKELGETVENDLDKVEYRPKKKNEDKVNDNKPDAKRRKKAAVSKSLLSFTEDDTCD